MKCRSCFRKGPRLWPFAFLLIASFTFSGWLDGGGGFEPPLYETIYAAPIALTGTIAFGTNNSNLLQAESHASLHLDDLERLVTQAYSGDSHLWLEYGVSTWNCTDHDHLEAITVQNGISAVGWQHDVRYSGIIWFQIVSQCEEDYDFDSWGEGAYWKGEQWYPAYEYPVSPEENIWIDQAYLTNCQFPWDINPSATEYGCGEEDVN